MTIWKATPVLMFALVLGCEKKPDPAPAPTEPTPAAPAIAPAVPAAAAPAAEAAVDPSTIPVEEEFEQEAEKELTPENLVAKLDALEKEVTD